jgi:hypothetical protein
MRPFVEISKNYELVCQEAFQIFSHTLMIDSPMFLKASPNHSISSSWSLFEVSFSLSKVFLILETWELTEFILKAT